MRYYSNTPFLLRALALKVSNRNNDMAADILIASLAYLELGFGPILSFPWHRQAYSVDRPILVQPIAHCPEFA